MKRKIFAVLTACISLLVCLFGMAMPVGAEEETYTLNFVDKTGLGYSMPDNMTANEGEEVELPDVTATADGKLGYWSLREDGKFKRYEPGELYTVKSNTTFYFVTPTIDLTIDAETENHVAQSFIYEITSTDAFSMVVCVDAGERLTIYDLPAVDYTVTELTAHSWRYTTATSQVGDTTSGKAITVKLENAVDGVVTVTFNHSDREDKWLTGADSKTLEYKPMFTVSIAITDYKDKEASIEHGSDVRNIQVYSNSSANTELYVRVAITTHYLNSEGNISGVKGSWDSELEGKELGEGWKKFGDFYYYTKPLKPNFATYEESEYISNWIFQESVSFPSKDAAWTVSAQSVEAHKDALRNTWGVVISEDSVTAAS